jgi:hypothetical protein
MRWDETFRDLDDEAAQRTLMPRTTRQSPALVVE